MPAGIPVDVPPPNDGTDTYDTIYLQRAPDSGGSPGAWATITHFSIDADGNFTEYVDASGVATSWYRYYYDIAAASNPSNFSAPMQAGSFLARSWILADIPDPDILTSAWDRWVQEAITDLWTEEGIWNWGRETITPTTTGSTPAGMADEWYGLPIEIEQVVKVEAVDSSTLLHRDWLYPEEEWQQVGRELRLFGADINYTLYVVHGKVRFRYPGELTEAFYMLFYWMVRMKYLQFREAQRANFLEWVTFGQRRSSITPEQIRLFKADARAEIDRRRDILGEIEPAGEAMPMGQPD